MKLSNALLERIIISEINKLRLEAKKKKSSSKAPSKATQKTVSGNVEAREVEADELADTLDKHIDLIKALKIEENRLVKRLKRLRETKRLTTVKIIKEI